MHKLKIQEKENPVHVKFEYEEAVNSKKDILSSEINFLKITKSVRAYQNLREKELRYKLRLIKKMSEIESGIKRLQKSVPRINIPRVNKKYEPAESSTRKYREDVESELLEIQRKLNSLA